MVITANTTYYKQLNEQIRASGDAEITIREIYGQRYLGCGTSGKTLKLYGTPGNGLGQYNNGSTIEVFGNCQEAVGDTMNHGDIITTATAAMHADTACAGGRIFIEGDIGYRAGIHMKAYMDKSPVLVVGGKAGSFLGRISGRRPDPRARQGRKRRVSGQLFLRHRHARRQDRAALRRGAGRPARQVLVRAMNEDDRAEIRPQVEDYCKFFGGNAEEILNERFYVLTANPEAGYKQLYTFE